MCEIDLSKVKYYPDRFYMCLDGFETENLTTFLSDFDIQQHQAVFIHEYYHYLTNITTFPGIRQFHLNFCDRFRLVTILKHKAKLDAFPISQNKLPQCKPEVEYWNFVSELIKEDDIDYELVQETRQSQNKRFEIKSINRDVIKTKEGERHSIRIDIVGLVDTQSFRLTFGALDEFLSSSIDEFLFQNDLSDIDPCFLNQRPFYPYQFFDKLLQHYGIQRPSAFEKVLIAYFAINSFNPPVKLIEILETLRDGGNEEFQQNPEQFLLKNFSDPPQYEKLLDAIAGFAQETSAQGRIHISQALRYYYDKFYTAQKLKEKDFFYFIRPFFQADTNTTGGKQKFLQALSRIINQFTPPVILQDKVFKTFDKLTNFGEATTLVIATYEIFESLKNDRIAKRPDYLKEKYVFPDNEPDCDNIEAFTPPPINGITFRLALNEISLYGLYLEELEAIKTRQKN